MLSAGPARCQETDLLGLHAPGSNGNHDSTRNGANDAATNGCLLCRSRGARHAVPLRVPLVMPPSIHLTVYLLTFSSRDCTAVRPVPCSVTVTVIRY